MLSKDRKKEHNRHYYQTHRGANRKQSVTLHVPGNLVGRITRFLHEGLARGTHRWSTPNEVYLALLFSGFEVLAQTIPSVAEALPEIQIQKEAMVHQAARRSAQAVKANLLQEIAELLAIKRTDAAGQLYRNSVGTIGQWTPTPWRDWLIEELEKAFPELKGGRVQGGTRLAVGNGNGNGKAHTGKGVAGRKGAVVRFTGKGKG